MSKSTHGRVNKQHRFSQIPSVSMQRSVFDRSSNLKTTFDIGVLIPIYVDEALPGDTFRMAMAHFARLATPLHPIMDNLYLDTFFFAVPNRLLWDNWEKFNGAQDDPGDSIDFLIPQIVAPASTGHTELEIYDYMGIPPGVADLTHSALPLRAYNLIYNEWFRDENILDSRVINKGDGPDLESDYVLLTRGKRHDYFTSCLPFPQKGPSVTLPLGSVAPVVGTTAGLPKFDAADLVDVGLTLQDSTTDDIQMLGSTGASDNPLKWNTTGLEADLTSATAATINAIREAFQIQRLLERDARGGTRYTELLRAHFQVTSPDSRLQRPEYLGGGSSPIMVNQVPQTSESGATPQGNLAAYGISTGQAHTFNKSFTEHCTIIGLCMIRADLTYQQGLERQWSRSTRYDFFWPALAQLGEQEVLQKEIFADGTSNDDIIFGYQERYAEYRYKPSHLTGQMRSSATLSLDTWHLAEDFAVAPTLNSTFITVRAPVDRVIAVPTEPHIILDAFFKLSCVRPMPTYSVPGMIDHF